MSSIDIQDIAVRGGTAALVAVIVNLILLELVLRFNIVAPFRPVSVAPIALFTVLGVAGATIVYAAVAKRHTSPDNTFRKIAAAVLILSFLPNIGIYFLDSSATASGTVFLMLLHTTTAVAAVKSLAGSIAP